MTDGWNINAGGRVYGPYTAQQLRDFVGEGRLAPHSLVARTGKSDFHAVTDDPDLRVLFEPAKPKPQFFTADNGTVAPHSFAARDEPKAAGPSRFIVLADMKSGSIAGIEQALFNLGTAHAVMPQAWILTCTMTINAVRNALLPKLGKLDTLFIVDATHNKSAWFNFGPEADARIRRAWQGDGTATKRIAG